MTRLIVGDPWRKSRFHDMRGNFVGARAIVRDLPRSLVEAAQRRALGSYPSLPWIPYPVIRILSRTSQPGWRVLEHGGGMSTIWWSQHVASVTTIEANVAWFSRIKAELQRRSIRNVHIELREGEEYSDLSEFPNHSFDLIVIDGHDRDKIALQALRVLSRPGWIYLDNTDFAAAWHEMYGEAEDILVQAAREAGGSFRYITGFAPATFVASQGLLIHIP